MTGAVTKVEKEDFCVRVCGGGAEALDWDESILGGADALESVDWDGSECGGAVALRWGSCGCEVAEDVWAFILKIFGKSDQNINCYRL